MAVDNYAIIDNGIVDNVILWDGETPWQPPEGMYTVLVPDGLLVLIGYLYDEKNGFSEPTFVVDK